MQRIVVLRGARDAIAARHDLGRLDHLDVGGGRRLEHRGRLRTVRVLVLVLHQRDRLQPAGHGDRVLAGRDRLRRGGDAHQPGRAHAVDRHAAHAVRHASGIGAQPSEVVALRALLCGDAEDHVIDLGAVDPRLGQCGANHMAAEHRRLGVVEGAAISLCDRRAGGGDDDGFVHGFVK